MAPNEKVYFHENVDFSEEVLRKCRGCIRDRVFQKELDTTKSVLRNVYVFAVFLGHDFGRFLRKNANVEWFWRGIWTENVARVLIKVSGEVDYYFDIRIN